MLLASAAAVECSPLALAAVTEGGWTPISAPGNPISTSDFNGGICSIDGPGIEIDETIGRAEDFTNSESIAGERERGRDFEILFTLVEAIKVRQRRIPLVGLTHRAVLGWKPVLNLEEFFVLLR